VLVLAALVCLSPAGVVGQARPDAPPQPPRIITDVIIRRDNIFSPAEARNFIPRLINSIHITTRASTIRRELLFEAGQPYDSALVAESERNLRRLGVFREVVIDTVHNDRGVMVFVQTADGWSTKADFRFRSAGGQVVYTVALYEENLLGTASQAGVRYRKTPDRSAVLLNFRRPRLIKGQVGVDFQYERRSDGELFYGEVAQPFFTLTTPSAFRVSFDQRAGRVLRFYDGELEARDSVQRRMTVARASAAWAIRAGPAGYLRWGLLAQARREDFAPELGGHYVMPRTWTGAAGPYLQWSRARYVVASGFRGVGRREDIDVSSTVLVGAMAAPSLLGYEHDGIHAYFSGRTGAVARNSFGYLDLSAGAMLTTAGVDTASVHAALTYIWQPGPRHFAVLHGSAGMQKDPRPGQEFDLGLGIGPRAARAHAFTGDRAFFTSAEYRFNVDDDFLALTGLGVAAFVDYGGAWYHGDPRRTGVHAGIGLRLAPSRSPGVEATRIDLARRFRGPGEPGSWALVIGKGFPFTTNGRLDY
jgi:hypothetical protein